MGILPTLENLLKNTEGFQPPEVYKAVNCRGFGRVDMIISEGQPFVLEINTIPGLTPMSLFPKAAAAAGISYSQLLDRLIELALEK